MGVGRRKAEGVDVDIVVLGGLSQTTENDLVGLVAGTQKRQAVECPGAGLYDGASGRDVAERS
jgi:hypothetical protein